MIQELSERTLSTPCRLRGERAHVVLESGLYGPGTYVPERSGETCIEATTYPYQATLVTGREQGPPIDAVDGSSPLREVHRRTHRRYRSPPYAALVIRNTLRGKRRSSWVIAFSGVIVTAATAAAASAAILVSLTRTSAQAPAVSGAAIKAPPLKSVDTH